MAGNSLNTKIGTMVTNYCNANSTVTAPASSTGAAFIFGKRGASGIVAIAWHNGGTPGVTMLEGNASWITVGYNNGITIKSNDAYTYLRVIWM